jgi:hypothetical protein
MEWYPYSQHNIILIYDSWFFEPGAKNDYARFGWTKAGELKIENNVICGSDVVSFYTSEPAMAKELRENLLRFKAEIPDDVSITIFEEEH